MSHDTHEPTAETPLEATGMLLIGLTALAGALLLVTIGISSPAEILNWQVFSASTWALGTVGGFCLGIWLSFQSGGELPW